MPQKIPHHRHKVTVNGKTYWTNYNDDPANYPTGSPDQTLYATAADITALEDKVKALAAAQGGGGSGVGTVPGGTPGGGTGTTPDPTPPPTGTPPTGTNVPATSGALKTAVNSASAGQTFIAAAGNHAYTSGIGYVGIKIDYPDDGVTIYGPDAVLKPAGVANGLAILADNCVVKGEIGGGFMSGTWHPITIEADAAGPASDANGSAMIGINGLPANNPDAPTNNTTIEDFVLLMKAVMDSSQQGVYLNGELHGVALRRGRFVANGCAGFGLHDYHAGPHPSDGYVFEDLRFEGFRTAIIMWNSVPLMTFRRTVITGTTGLYSARFGSGGTVRIENSTFDKPVLNEGATIVDGGGNTGLVIVHA
jgi:hypothetical protein